MKKQIVHLVLSAVLAIPFLGFAQQPNIRPCDTYGAMEQVFAEDAQLRINFENAQKLQSQQMLDYNQLLSNGKMSAAPEYTIPVVFHILHMGGTENITDAECIA